MKKLIYILPLIAFFVLVGFFVIGLQKDPSLIPSPLIGKPVPAFTTTQLLDTDKSFSQADLKGEVSLLNFWATWCPTCRAEHDVFMEIARNKLVPIYGIDYKDKPEDAKQWLAQLGDPYKTVAVDPKGEIGINWGLYGTPETFVIDQQGIIRYKHVGPVSWQVWKEDLEPIVNELRNK